MARKLIVEIVGDASNFNRQLAGATKATNTFSASLKSLAKAAGLTFGAIEVVNAFKDVIDKAEQSQVSMAKLTTAFKSSGVSMKEYAAAVEEAQASGRKLGFTNIDTQGSLAKLVVATQSGTLAIKDLSTAQDLARFRHIDLTAASQMLAQAMTGSARAVKQLGINVVPVQTNLLALKAAHKESGRAATEQEIATAKLADKQATGAKIIEIVTQRLHGQADAYSKTAAGAMARFRASLEDIEERIGSKVLPVMTDLINYVLKHQDDIGKFFSDARKEIQPLIDAIKNLGQAINGIVEAFGGWGKVIRDVMAVLKVPIQNVVFPFTTMWKLLQGDWAGAWNAFKAPAIAAWNAVMKVIQPVIDAIKYVFGAGNAAGNKMGPSGPIGPSGPSGPLGASGARGPAKIPPYLRGVTGGGRPPIPYYLQGVTGGPKAVQPSSSTPHNTRNLPNYPAFDYMTKPGTAVLAPENGYIVGHSGHAPTGNPADVYGWSLYFYGTESHSMYYMTHLSDVAGDGYYSRGSVIGYVADQGKGTHLHVGLNKGSGRLAVPDKSPRGEGRLAGVRGSAKADLAKDLFPDLPTSTVKVKKGRKPTAAEVIAMNAARFGLDPAAVYAYMMEESHGSWKAVGDHGTSFGPFQMHRGGALGKHSAAWAMSPAGLIAGMRMMSQSGARGMTGADALWQIYMGFGKGSNNQAAFERALPYLSGKGGSRSSVPQFQDTEKDRAKALADYRKRIADMRQQAQAMETRRELIAFQKFMPGGGGAPTSSKALQQEFAQIQAQMKTGMSGVNTATRKELNAIQTMLKNPWIPPEVRAVLKSELDRIRQTFTDNLARIKTAQAGFGSVVSDIGSQALSAFDAINAKWMSPAAKKLQQMQAEDTAKQAQQAYADAVTQYGADSPEAKQAARALTESQLSAQAQAEQDAHDAKVKADKDALEKRLAALMTEAGSAKTRAQALKIQKKIQATLAEFGITPASVQAAMDWNASQTLFVSSMGSLKESIDALTRALGGKVPAAPKAGGAADDQTTSLAATIDHTKATLDDLDAALDKAKDGFGNLNDVLSKLPAGAPPGLMPHAQTGGYLPGMGGIPIMAHGGEYVINAGATRKLGLPFLNRLNRYQGGGVITPGGPDDTPAARAAAAATHDWGTDNIPGSYVNDALLGKYGRREQVKAMERAKIVDGMSLPQLPSASMSGGLYTSRAMIGALTMLKASNPDLVIEQGGPTQVDAFREVNRLGLGMAKSLVNSANRTAIMRLTDGALHFAATSTGYEAPSGMFDNQPQFLRGGQIPSFAQGGIMPHDGLAYLHRGETVSPGDSSIHIYLDGKEITSVVESRFAARGRRGGPYVARRPS